MRINFNKNAKLHEICAIDELRESMEYVYFDEGNAVCSEGHIMAIFKISEISTIGEEQIKLLEGKFIHRSAFKEMLKYNEIVVESDFITAKGNGFDVRFTLKSDIKYPNYKKVISDAIAYQGKKEKVTIDSKLLDLLQRCVGSTGSIINMSTGLQGMIVGYPSMESYALIMPQCFD
jgi:hypothetical protein